MENKLSVLVIDDEAPLADIYTSFLGKMGADVKFCDHPQKAWQAIDKEKYDLIITDLRMPVITGDEFISIVRASKLNAHTPIILCSAYINKLVITEITRESKVYFLTKPFDSKALLELVSKAVGVKRVDTHEKQSLNEQWLNAFSLEINKAINEKVSCETIDQFETWNFDSISANFFVIQNNEQISVNLLMKEKTFLKVAGKIQGTQYKEIEAETIHVWKELIRNMAVGTSRVTFSKVLSQTILTLPEEKADFSKFTMPSGEVLVYID
jgi:CheY-like chemotaxis protein